MKKLKLILLLIVPLSTVSCAKKDPPVVTRYIYRNNSSGQITVKAYSPVNINGKWEDGKQLFFELQIGQSYSLETSSVGGSFTGPLLFLNGGGSALRDSTIISNSTSEIIHRCWLESGFLYDINSYTFTQPSKYTGVFTYVFTDQFFTD